MAGPSPDGPARWSPFSRRWGGALAGSGRQDGEGLPSPGCHLKRHGPQASLAGALAELGGGAGALVLPRNQPGG